MKLAFAILLALAVMGIPVTAAPVPKLGAQCPFAWLPSPDLNVQGYYLYSGTNSHSYQTSVYVAAGVLTNTVTLTNLWFNATNYVAATTLDADGVESDFSNEATFYTNSAQPPKGFWRWFK